MVEPNYTVIDIDCPEPFLVEGCQYVDSKGELQDCPFSDGGYCTKDSLNSTETQTPRTTARRKE